jgi:hypothetical protein
MQCDYNCQDESDKQKNGGTHYFDGTLREPNIEVHERARSQPGDHFAEVSAHLQVVLSGVLLRQILSMQALVAGLRSVHPFVSLVRAMWKACSTEDSVISDAAMQPEITHLVMEA